MNNRKLQDILECIGIFIVGVIISLWILPNTTCCFQILIPKENTMADVTVQIYSYNNHCYLVAEKTETGYRITGKTNSPEQATRFKLDAKGHITISNIDKGFYLLTNVFSGRFKGHNWFSVRNSSDTQTAILTVMKSRIILPLVIKPITISLIVVFVLLQLFEICTKITSQIPYMQLTLILIFIFLIYSYYESFSWVLSAH